MRTMQQWLDEYGERHRHPANKGIHWICVPAILFSVLPGPGALSVRPVLREQRKCSNACG